MTASAEAGALRQRLMASAEYVPAPKVFDHVNMPATLHELLEAAAINQHEVCLSLHHQADQTLLPHIALSIPMAGVGSGQGCSRLALGCASRLGGQDPSPHSSLWHPPGQRAARVTAERRAGREAHPRQGLRAALKVHARGTEQQRQL